MFNAYQLNDQVVYKGKGIGTITNIINKSVNGENEDFYVLKMANKDIEFEVPATDDSIVPIGKYDIYEVNEQVVCKGQGVGTIINIITKEIDEEKEDYYVLKMLNKDVQIEIPKFNNTIIRNLTPDSELPKLLTFLKDKPVEVPKANWNKRSRDYSLKLKNGTIYDLAEILRELNNKKLSFSEKKIFDLVKELLIQEIKTLDNNEIIAQIDSYLNVTATE